MNKGLKKNKLFTKNMFIYILIIKIINLKDYKLTFEYLKLCNKFSIYQ